MLDNCSVAILNSLNELAVRCGLKPTDYVALTGWSEAHQSTILKFESPPDREVDNEKFASLLGLLGLEFTNTPTLVGTDTELYNRLQSALAKAPTSRRR